MRFSGVDLSLFSGPRIVKYEITSGDTLLSTVVIRSQYVAEIRTPSGVLSIKPKESSLKVMTILSSDGSLYGEIHGITRRFPEIIIHSKQGDEVWRAYKEGPWFAPFFRLFESAKSGKPTFYSGNRKIIFNVATNESWKWKANYGKTQGAVVPQITGDISPEDTDIALAAICVFVIEQIMWHEQ